MRANTTPKQRHCSSYVIRVMLMMSFICDKCSKSSEKREHSSLEQLKVSEQGRV